MGARAHDRKGRAAAEYRTDTELNPMSPGTFVDGDSVRPWASLSEDEKTLFSRMAEVYAAYSEYTDVQIGRVIDYLEESGQLENTLIFYCADNGASGEGSPNGSVNENRFFNGYPDDIESNLAMIDKLGSPETYNHYPTGWAVAFSTPYRMFKRYSQYAGGTADPMVIHWPKGFKARGEIRDQYHHCTDVVPTILECCGLTMPEVVEGVRQTPLAGVSMRYSFDDADAPTRKETQYYEMLSTRGLWHNGWKVSTEHGPMINKGEFDEDRWQLFHTDVDRSEAHDLAAEHPEKVKELSELWLAEAKKNNVLPLNDYGVEGIHALEYKVAPPEDGRYTYYPGTSEVPEASAARTLGASFKILAEVEFTKATAGRDRLAGFTLRRIHDVRKGRSAVLRLQLPRHRAGAEAELPGAHVGKARRRRRLRQELRQREARGARDDDAVRRRRRPSRRRTSERRAAITRWPARAWPSDVTAPTPFRRSTRPGFAFTGGRIFKVTYDVGDDAYIDLERRLGAILARD